MEPILLGDPSPLPKELPTARAAAGGPWGLGGVQVLHLFGEIGPCLGRWAAAKSLLKLNELYLNYCPGASRNIRPIS